MINLSHFIYLWIGSRLACVFCDSRLLCICFDILTFEISFCNFFCFSRILHFANKTIRIAALFGVENILFCFMTNFTQANAFKRDRSQTNLILKSTGNLVFSSDVRKNLKCDYLIVLLSIGFSISQNSLCGTQIWSSD